MIFIINFTIEFYAAIKLGSWMLYNPIDIYLQYIKRKSSIKHQISFH